MIGNRSITVPMSVKVAENDCMLVTIQTNRNLSICDMSPRIGEILSDFQGRQLLYIQSDGEYGVTKVYSQLWRAIENYFKN